jgi:hypothetical protein
MDQRNQRRSKATTTSRHQSTQSVVSIQPNSPLTQSQSLQQSQQLHEEQQHVIVDHNKPLTIKIRYPLLGKKRKLDAISNIEIENETSPPKKQQRYVQLSHLLI